MSKCYINGVACISAQHTADNTRFLDEVVNYEKNIIHAIPPIYKDYIAPAAARRMAKGVKMGVVASSIALKEAAIESPDAIITGTGMGCLIDSEKFLTAIIDNDEEYLTPTSFIQSTHNTVGAQVALGLKCNAYNFTYVQAAVSFESCLFDAQLMLNEKEANTILVGGVDELGPITTKYYGLIDHIKDEEINTTKLLDSKTGGSIFGEGASFFVLSNEKQESTYAQLVDVEIISELNIEALQGRVHKFLEHNNTSINDIDAVILGNNGDIDYDNFYKELQTTIFKNTQQLYYKHLCGEFGTASSFGFWIAAMLIKNQRVPDILKMNTKETKSYKNVLLYNQYRGKNHSLVLIRSC